MRITYLRENMSIFNIQCSYSGKNSYFCCRQTSGKSLEHNYHIECANNCLCL